MHRAFIAGLFFVSLALPMVLGGPVQPFGDEEKGFHQMRLEPFAVRTFTQECKGGERTCVIAIGQGTTPLGVYVYDVHGNCVAWDDYSLSDVADDLALEFHPPQQGVYEVEIRNFGRRSNSVELAVR